MKSLVEPGARNTESQRGGRSGNGGHVVWNREIDAARVLQIVAGDDLEHQSGVHDRARHRPYVVQGPRTGYDSRGAHPTVRGFESNNAAVASRLADGTSSIGADRPVTHLRRDCDRRPAVSTKSLRAIGIPWSGPFQRPRWISASAARASTSAESAVTVMKAFSLGLSCSMRPRHAFVNSTGEIFLLCTSSAASERVSDERLALLATG